MASAENKKASAKKTTSKKSKKTQEKPPAGLADIEWNLRQEVFIEEPVQEELVEEAIEDTEALDFSERVDEEMNHESIFHEAMEPGFLPLSREEQLGLEEVEEEAAPEDAVVDSEAVNGLAGTELEGFESAAIEESEFVEVERLQSIVESILFASDRPVSLASIRQVFKGTNIKTEHIRKALNTLSVDYASGVRGVTLEEVTGGYQLRTKLDNLHFLKRTLKARPFKLSGPALEVLAIVAYKQPVVKAEIDQIRGVESGHLLRALMEKGLVNFDGKSDLPGKPMFYSSTKKFLEVFGLRNLKELPSLSEIDELLPDGIGDEETEKKTTLDMITDSLSQQAGTTYSQGEDELMNISSQLENIHTSSDFFEQEKRKEQERKNADKADRLREALEIGQSLSTRDKNWLMRYDQALSQGQQFDDDTATVQAAAPPVELAEEVEGDDPMSEDFLNDSSKDDLEDEI